MVSIFCIVTKDKKKTVTIQSPAGDSVGNFVVKALQDKKRPEIMLRLNSYRKQIFGNFQAPVFPVV
jgi:hypothetical protein